MASGGFDASVYELNTERFKTLLAKLIREAEFTQNSPPSKIPQEDRIGNHVLETLAPHMKENGGPLVVTRVNYHAGRNNIMIEYPGTHATEVVSFIGSHMDVVPANASDWKRPPFELIEEGDNLFGRGTTDCLGHVALLTDFFCQLSEKKAVTVPSIIAVFIANEEDGQIEGVGIDEMAKRGLLNRLKNGPAYWIDSADQQPMIGTGTALGWKLTATGKMGHSGLPYNAINPMLVAYEAVAKLMEAFHRQFPAHPSEAEYGYACPSTMKPLMCDHPPGAMNQIPKIVTISGDIRGTPFYTIADIKACIEAEVARINENITELPSAKAYKFFPNQLPDGTRASIALQWVGEGNRGVACNIKSAGYRALSEATTEVVGVCKPESITGTLPLIADLVDEGFDIQIVGYGVEAVYHGIDEYCTLSGMRNGMKVFARIVQKLQQK